MSIGVFHKTLIAGCAVCIAVTAVASLMAPASDATTAPRVTFASADAEVANLFDGLDKPAPQPRVVAPRSVARLADTFEDIGYDWEDVRALEDPVPRVFLTQLPKDLPTVKEVEFRKSLFFRTMLPLVLKANEKIRGDRDRLLRLRAKTRLGYQLLARDRLWLSALADYYRLTTIDLDALVGRVDIVPVSLAMAQAAEESGWGTSRFAQKANALFGQWTVQSDDGIVPKDREPGKTHKIKAFESLQQSVSAYMRNLNSHRAYRNFRAKRASDRANGRQPDGWRLASTLEAYSQRGDDYIKSIRIIIDANELQPLDTAEFEDVTESDTSA